VYSGSGNIDEIERCLLGSFLMGAGIPAAVQELMFSSSQNRLIFSALKRFADEGNRPDIVMLKRLLDAAGKLEAAGGSAYIASLTNIIPSSANGKWYLEAFLENYEKRVKGTAIRLAAEKIAGGGSVPEIASDLIKTLSENPAHQGRKTSWTVKELLEHEFPPVQWIVPGLIVPGLTLVAGASKIGKSWLALAMAYATATGGHVLGTIPVEKHDVLYLSLEDVGRRLKERLVKIGAGKITSLRIEERWNLGILGITNYIRQHPETRFVIIDTWVQFFPKGDTNDYSEMSKRAASLKAVADDLDIAIMATHHTRKGLLEGGDWMDSIMGSQGLAGAADSVLMLKRGRGEAQAELHAVGRDILEQDLLLTFDSDCAAWTIAGSKTEIQDSESRQLIYDWLKGNGPHGPRAAFKGLKEEGYKGTESTIQNIMTKMEKQGALNKTKDGIYSIPASTDTTGSIPVTSSTEKTAKDLFSPDVLQKAIEPVEHIEPDAEKTIELTGEELEIF
jgi:replicative DNA helicase